MRGDCLEVMKGLPNHSADLILCDLPYGTTRCVWDAIIPFEPLWIQYKRLVKAGGAIVLFANQPFTTALISSYMTGYKYSWIWEKNCPTGFANAKKRPLKVYEDIVVFNANRYYPQDLVKVDVKRKNSINTGGATTGEFKCGQEYQQEYSNYPRNILRFPTDSGNKVHPTQKPVKLLEYLIRTYTLEGEVVLDNCMGSGSTGVACVNTGRQFIGIERETEYYQIAEKRIADAQDCIFY